MEQEKHTLNLGKLLVNFQSLEFILRAFLYENNKNGNDRFKLDALKEGDILEENAFINYDSLGELINKYNNNPKISSKGLTIDKSIVEVRDAIAHGRVFGINPQPPMTLLKFDKPIKRQVKVTFSVQLTKEWFDKQIPRVQKEVVIVAKALEMLQRGSL